MRRKAHEEVCHLPNKGEFGNADGEYHVGNRLPVVGGLQKPRCMQQDILTVRNAKRIVKKNI